MKLNKVVPFFLCLFCFFFANASISATVDLQPIRGMGAWSVYPLLSRWLNEYAITIAKSGYRFDYYPYGAGAALDELRAGNIDFATSGSAVPEDLLAKWGLEQFPLVTTAIVVIVNIPNVPSDQLVLSGPVLADIFMGKIKTWNDPSIVKLNPNLTLPAMAILPVHQSISSGSTYDFTHYLTEVSPNWAKYMGYGLDLQIWPAGVGQNYSFGVAKYVESTPGTIGYIEYSYALSERLPMISLLNHEGYVVAPSVASITGAISQGDWQYQKKFALSLVNQSGATSWPITMVIYLLVPDQTMNTPVIKEVLKFFVWCYEQGDQFALNLGYVPIPLSTRKAIEGAWVSYISPGSATQ